MSLSWKVCCWWSLYKPAVAVFFFLLARFGNFVPPPFVEVLVMGNFPELCQKRDAAA
ncbi:hypothetical protein CSC12_5597 [Klebsiella michiganensis]|nr:hypothetical protein CSC12_5597 [Klebsiella michiganensis]DAO82081.1 MAG TPA: hypothetical protein [Caudoviricetes sp.]DAQ51602.1 MAG TPA: hypothetical protein [Caudoviricetes sp.]